jgi:hypothetical protein
MGTIVSFRVGQNDVQILAKYFQPLFDEDDLLRVANHNCIVRTLINGVPTDAFSMEGVPPPAEETNEQLVIALKQLSATKYGHPKAEVAEQISERLATKEVSYMPNESFGKFPSDRPPSDSPRPKAPSFLDEWLEKRKQMPPSPRPNTNMPSSDEISTVVDHPTALPQAPSQPNDQQQQPEQEFKIQRNNPTTVSSLQDEDN